MNQGGSIRRLGRFLEECERADARVGLCDRCVSVEDGRARASLELTVATDRGDCGRDVADVTLGDDGTLSLTLDDALPADADGVTLDADAATIGDDALTVALTATVDADDAPPDTARDESDAVRERSDAVHDEPASRGDEADPAADATDPVAAARDPNVPPFRDRAYLAAIYESAETFDEMADVIDMDVTAETVRRYMIQNEVHDPTSYDTADADGTDDAPNDRIADGTPEDGVADGRNADETPGDATGNRPADRDTGDASADDGDVTAGSAVVADGMGLPDSVTVDDLVDAVERANTIHEVGRTVGLERMDALDLLQRLDLLEFVMGRLSTEAERDVSREQILERVRHAAAGSGSPGAAPS